MPKQLSCQEAVATSLDFRNNIFKNQSLLHLPTQLVKKKVFSLDMDGVISCPPPHAGSPLLAHLPRVIDVTNLINAHHFPHIKRPVVLFQ